MKTSTSNSDLSAPDGIGTGEQAGKNFFSFPELSGVKKLAAAVVILLCGLTISYKANAQCFAGFYYFIDTATNTVSFLDTSYSPVALINSWYWDFGDGFVDSIQNPTHIYAVADTYYVCQTIWDDSACTNTLCIWVITGAGSVCTNPPAAGFTYSASNLTVNFTDLSTPAVCITSWLWDFGDGNTDTIQNPSHTYAAVGTYNVCLIISTFAGIDTLCYSNVTVVGGSGCSAGFSYSVDSTNTAWFTDTSSGTGGVIAWYWDFGDGSADSLQQNPSHTYAVADTYWVCLTIWDSSNCTNIWCTTVITTIINCNNPPVANFTYTIPSPYTANFFDASTPVACITSWSWDFGDGNTETIQNPSHTYAVNGSYIVCLITSTIGGSDTVCMSVTVVGTCFAAFSYWVDSTNTAWFTDSSYTWTMPPQVWSWAWDFGDGDTSALQNPTHFYAVADTYWVCLTILVDSACTDTWCTMVLANGVPCQRTISGQVSDSAGAIISGTVDLINYSPVPGQMTIAATTVLDSLLPGYYTFTNVSQGQYLIRAEGDSLLYPNTVLTYYDSTNHWQNATTVDASSVCDTTIIANIQLVEFPTNIGPAKISGQITSSGPFKDGKNPIDPVPGIDIVVEEIATDKLIAGTTTDGLGFYYFENIPLGDYRLYVDITGLPMDSTYYFSVTNADTLFTNLDFFVDSVSITLTPLTSVQENLNDHTIKIYPNPYKDFTNIEFTLKETSSVSLEVYNILGAKINTIENSKKQPGHHNYKFSVKDLGYPAGLYLIKLNIDLNSYSLRILEF
ncbi:MAG: PKD domain-containing protein [Cytophagales bacterium]|nr:PKD domain-containing protein [Cytophagales bacterium]